MASALSSQHYRSPSLLLESESDEYVVGTLFQLDPGTGNATDPLHIYCHQEVYVGRNRKKCQYVVDDPVVSNKHLRIYTIVYDHDNPLEVAPLVYAQDMSLNGSRWNGALIDRGNGGVLLSDGDILQLSPAVYLLFRCCGGQKQMTHPFSPLQRREMKAFESLYTVTGRRLGAGAYGQVHMAVEVRSGQQLACKIVDIRALTRQVGGRDFDSSCSPASPPASPPSAETSYKWTNERKKSVERRLYREVQILKQLCHPNIIRLERVIKTEHTLYIFQDLITAGDLFSFLEYKGGKLVDIEAAVIVRQILMALDYLHGRNIVHRDLKPDNILMTSLANGCRVVLCDFGGARIVESTSDGGKRMSSFVGTLEYIAPEITRTQETEYTKSVDMWSLGCVTVVILTGAPPFRHSESFSFSESQARQCDLNRLREDPDWAAVGDRPKAFVYRLLVLDETKRMDAKAALQHAWFTNPKHKSQLDAVYKRAIRDWKPRAVREPMVMKLDLERKQPAERLDQVRWQVMRSDQSIYFRPTDRSALCKSSFNSGGLPQSGAPFSIKWSSTATFGPTSTDTPARLRIASPTLSDPDFPVEEEQDNRVNNILPKENKGGSQLNPRKEQSTKKYKYQNSGSNNGTAQHLYEEDRALISAPRQPDRNRHRPGLRLCLHRLPFSPQAWTWGWSDRNSQNEKQVVVHGKDLRGDAQKTRCQACPETNDGTTTITMQKGPDIAAKMTTTTTTAGRKRRIEEVYSQGSEADEEDEEDEEDEIYEEVENPFSGKIYRVIYGTRNYGGV